MEETASNAGERSPETGREQVPSFEEIIGAPMTEEEARVQLADAEIRIAQCIAAKASIDKEIADIQTVRAIVMRRILNPQKQDADGSGD